MNWNSVSYSNFLKVENKLLRVLDVIDLPWEVVALCTSKTFRFFRIQCETGKV